MTISYSPLCIAVLASISAPLLANEKDIQKDEHNIEKLLITASPLKRNVLESSTPVAILSGEQLEQFQAATLGETLKNMPGVNSSYFGPVSSSPIIRGLDGPRIKVVQNGLDASDASRVGPDHSVATEVSTASQIEVMRGPATLLYGSGAIGGVVNVVDNRLPFERQDGLSGKVAAQYDSVSDERAVSTDLNGGAGELAWHLDAFKRQTNDYRIPGSAAAESHEDEHEEEHEEHDDQQTDSNKLANSSIDAQGFTFGTGWIGDNSRVAFAFGRLESDYGIPGHAHHHEEEGEEGSEIEEEESVYASLTQNRYQLVADWNNLDGLFSSVHWRNGYTDYQHSEIEHGEVGTTFKNNTLESRLWAEHTPIMGWKGVVGVQYNNMEFAADGQEAFTPSTDSESVAMYVLEEKASGDLLWQLGMRVEQLSHQPQVDITANLTDPALGQLADSKQQYTAFSGSAGLVWKLDEQQSLAFNYAFSERAPSASEIFANGPHIGTGTYEVGGAFTLVGEGDNIVLSLAETEMDKEQSNNLDITYRYHHNELSGSVSLFYNQINNYVFQQNTDIVVQDGQFHQHEEHDQDHDLDHGETDHADDADEQHGHDEDMPVYIYAQQDARIYGFEAELDWHFADNWRITGFTDYTRAKLDDGSNVPRIPPLRVGSALHFEYDRWHAEFGATRYNKQDKYAEYESETDGYTLVSASVNYYLPAELADITLFVKGDNLTDQEARVHSSFIKNVAPLPGRSIRVGIKANF